MGNSSVTAGFGTCRISGYENGSQVAVVSLNAKAGTGVTVSASDTENDVDFISFFVQYKGGTNTQAGSYDVFATKNGSFR